MRVRFESISKQYGDFHAVRNLDLTIEDGALHFLLGPSGCGKTTSLRMLAGLEKPTSGKIYFDDRDVTNMPASDRGIGMVFQNYALWPHMTVLKNVEYGLKLRKLSKQEVQRRVDEVLDITQLTRFAERLPGQLSGGQQQRVALARALAIRPNVLLLDEPLSNLDAQLRLEMRDNIVRIHQQTKITTVYVTHDQKEALSMGTQVSVMHAGHLIQTDAPKKLYHRPKTPFIANFIGETNLFDAVYGGLENGLHLIKVGAVAMHAANIEGSFQVGEKVKVSVRPETLLVGFRDFKIPDRNRLPLKLDSLSFLGKSEQMSFFLHGEQAPMTVKANVFHAPDHDFKAGDDIWAAVEPEDVLILPVGEHLEAGT